MNINITPENVYFGVTMLLLSLQARQYLQVEKLKKENEKLWDQISTFNTMVALKLLEMQQEISKLKENKDNGK